ncbi:hypothetical protein OGAPHI_002012 [Ogataea philodendri]|uniref:RBR-type E3 ubiquitin transferase n=1 Tax=Ogataea philodendri TaxID=1378263 RepID=A0A9P8P9N3_9ASCO|nr:uncharacterized protein OGAPHI_002012 [Ogataea philodendri]KAH3668258.1 hypothetical protein OGAPHI_002012 [Ogataea philodendri]
MSDYEFEYETEDEYSNLESEADSLDDLDSEDEIGDVLRADSVHYSFKNKQTAGGLCTHRMRYKPVEADEIEAQLKARVANVDTILQLGADDCTVLLLKYGWNDQKLLEDYTTQEPESLRRECGLGPESRVRARLVRESEPQFLCQICCSDGPLYTFQLSWCDHRYCVDCYVRYIRGGQSALVKCPDTSCALYVRPGELEQLSTFEEQRVRQQEEHENQLRKQSVSGPLTSEEIMAKYQKPLVDSSDEELDEDQESDESAEDALFNFHERHIKQQRLEKQNQRNKILLRRYWYTVVVQYTKKHFKTFKNCPAIDCECFIEYLGFDSDVITSVEEYVAHKYIPIVQCSNGHRFCYACLSEDHAPATCTVVQTWIKTCADETETSHWITANTKDCPKCSSPIEKNGGCNHMTCGECHYQFCWICLGDWSRHKNNYVCTSFNDEESKKEREKQETSRVSLKRYLFYFDLFEIHRVSLKKDTEFLAKLEHRVQEIQQRAKVSWIEAHFYRESIDILLRCRITLMWSYALMFYFKSSAEKGFLERTQSNLSNHVEALSKLFEITPTEKVIKEKEAFLTKSNALKSCHEKCIEKFMESLVLGRISFTSELK